MNNQVIVAIKEAQGQICSGVYIPYSIRSVALMLWAAFCVKLCLSRLIPSDPSSPSDTETQKREDRRAGRTVREEIRKRLCKYCDLVEADRNTFIYANYGMLNLKSAFTYSAKFKEKFHQ